MRPSFGRVSRFGAMAIAWTMDKLGPMARTAEDCGLVLSILAGHDPRDLDRKSTRLNSSHLGISYAVFCLKKKKKIMTSSQSYQIRSSSSSRLSIFSAFFLPSPAPPGIYTLSLHDALPICRASAE